ncbi:MAG: SURF1 family protein [Hyphomicrobiales bacterium]
MSSSKTAGSPGGFVVVSIFAAVSLAVLVGLGVWQLQRLSWKTGLIEDITARAAEAPAGLDVIVADRQAGKEIRFRRVTLTGTYDHDNELHVYGILNKYPGWRVVTPMILADNKLVLVDRGFVPEEKKQAQLRADGQVEGSVTITGSVRTRPEGKGFFVPANEPESNKWYWYSMTNMLGQVSDKTNATGQLFFVQLDEPDHGGAWPQALKVSPKINNPHLGYALTWFGLALTLLGVYAAYILTAFRKKSK